MLKKQLSAISLFSVLLPGGNAWAHHPTGMTSAGHAGPVITISATPIEKGKIPVAVQAEYIDMDPFSDHELIGYSNSGKDAHSVASIFHTVLGIGYGLTDDLTLGLKIPYEQLDNIREAHADEPGEVHRHGDAQGLGDLTLFGQYRIVNSTVHKLEAALLFGLKMPTGETHDRDRDGVRFETEFQPGSGAWSPLAGLALSKRFERVSLDTNIMYTFANQGAQDTDLGDMFNYNAALSWRAMQNAETVWDVILEANGEWKQKQEINGEEDENSGERAIFLTPATRVSWRQWSAFLSVGLPVVQDLNGIQNKISAKTMAGISVVF